MKELYRPLSKLERVLLERRRAICLVNICNAKQQVIHHLPAQPRLIEPQIPLPFLLRAPDERGIDVGVEIMRTHQGTVDVRSAPNTGSVFTLFFPVSDLPVARSVAPPLKREIVSGQGKHVMYVDDDEALVFLVERVLTRKGFKVSSFTDPRLASEALRAHPQDFDLLVTDYNMPGFCGVDLLREARAVRPDLPVALASGYVTAEIEAAARAEGARALIHKPNDVEELCETVQRLVMGDDGG